MIVEYLNDWYLVEVDIFMDEMLVGFFFDCLLEVKCGLIKMLFNLRVVYYVLDGKWFVVKSVMVKKRVEM